MKDIPVTNSTRWTKEQVKLAFHLYCQIPFGKIDHRNNEIIALASILGRTPSAVAMKMLNIASLDPAITSSGRSGLGNASVLDREVWNEFNDNWEKVAFESSLIRAAADNQTTPSIGEANQVEDNIAIDNYASETKQVIINQRIKQNFFRRAVLSSYRGRCCISGISETRLLIASHIVPWSQDKNSRLNPSNGLCLSSLHDKAFDCGLISIDSNYRVLISDTLKRSKDVFIQNVLLPLEGHIIELPERFLPDQAFLNHHRTTIFIAN